MGKNSTLLSKSIKKDCIGNQKTRNSVKYGVELMNENFQNLKPGPVIEVNNGPYREMHARYSHPNDNMDSWQCKVGHWSLGDILWECKKTDKGKKLCSVPMATVYDNVTIAKGDFKWKNIKIESSFKLIKTKNNGYGGPVGLIFRFLDSMRYYAAVFDRDGQMKILKRIVGNHWDLPVATPFPVKTDKNYKIVVKLDGPEISAKIDNVKLKAIDHEYETGIVGFIGASPAEFAEIKVFASENENKRLAKFAKKQSKQIIKKREKSGQAILWKKISTKGFGSGRRIRLGDLTGNGIPDILLSQLTSQNECRNISYLAAMTLDGKILWEKGKPSPAPQKEFSADVPAQIHDIDGDGKNEVVCVIDGKIYALEGTTGRIKYFAQVPPPSQIPDVYKQNINHWGGFYDDLYPGSPVCALTFADFAGCSQRRDVILSGHYHQTIALDSKFKERWRHINVHGHYPIPYLPNRKKRDHLLNGYHHLDADGNIVGRIYMMDHPDAIFVGPLDDRSSEPDKILMAGGDDGLLLLTPDYNLHARVMGHVQRLAIGKFLKDVPGLCIGTVLFHGNRGITSMFDSTLKRIWTKDFPVIGSTLQPVIFDNSPEEKMFLSGIRPLQGYQGGLIDGNGDMVSPLPDDGGPGMCALAHDLDNDGLDELILWDYERIWIYHSDTEPDQDKMLKRKRPPLYNMSNFQAYWSLPLLY